MPEYNIFNEYRQVLLYDQLAEFPDDFTLKDRDLFYRLKFRALNDAQK